MLRIIGAAGKRLIGFFAKGFKKVFGRNKKAAGSISKRAKTGKNLGTGTKLATKNAMKGGAGRMAAFRNKYPKVSKALKWTWTGTWLALDAVILYELFAGDEELDEESFDEATDAAIQDLMGTPLTQEALSIIYSQGRIHDIKVAVAHYISKTELEDLDDHGIGIIECALDYKSKAFDDYMYSPAQVAAVTSFLTLLPTGLIPSATEIEEVIAMVEDSVMESRMNEMVASIETDYITHYYLALFTSEGNYDEILEGISDRNSAAMIIESYLSQDSSLVKSAVKSETGGSTNIPSLESTGGGSFSGLDL